MMRAFITTAITIALGVSVGCSNTDKLPTKKASPSPLMRLPAPSNVPTSPDAPPTTPSTTTPTASRTGVPPRQGPTSPNMPLAQTPGSTIMPIQTLQSPNNAATMGFTPPGVIATPGLQNPAITPPVAPSAPITPVIPTSSTPPIQPPEPIGITTPKLPGN